MFRYPFLEPSPLEEARHKHGLEPRQAAERLHIPILRLARLEAATRRFTPSELRRLTVGLEPGPKFYQLSFFDSMTDNELAGIPASRAGERRGHA